MYIIHNKGLRAINVNNVVRVYYKFDYGADFHIEHIANGEVKSDVIGTYGHMPTYLKAKLIDWVIDKIIAGGNVIHMPKNIKDIKALNETRISMERK